MSLWKKISLGVLIFMVLLAGALAFLVGTTSGLHLLFKAANRWVPGLSIEQVTGGWQSLTLKNVHYQQPGVAVSTGQLHLAVKTDCLWNSSLCVNDIALTDVNVVIDRKKMPPSAAVETNEREPLHLATPYLITLSRVALHNVNIKIDDTRVSVMDFSSGLRWQGKNLTLTPTALQGLLVALPKAAKIAPPHTEKKTPAETLRSLFSSPLLPEIADVHLPLNLAITAFHGTQLRLTGDSSLTIDNLRLKASSIDGNIQLETLDIDASQGTVHAAGAVQLQGNWPIEMTLNSTLNIGALQGEKVTLKVAGDVRKRLDVSANLTGPVNMAVHAQTQLSAAGLPLNIELLSPQFYWPFTGERQFQADNLKLTLSGKITDYTLSFHTALKGQGIPPAVVTLDAKGNAQQLNLNKLTVAALEGKTELKALLDWQQAMSWRGELTLNGINTAKEFPDWPSTLNGLINMRGSLDGSRWQVAVPTLKLTGNIKQNKVNVEGSLQGNSDMQWNIPGVHLALGRNRVDVQGESGADTLDLGVAIDAPDLDNVLPGLGGTIKGAVNIHGTLDAPQLLAEITARKLRWQDLSVAQVRVTGDVKSSDQITGNLNVGVEGIVLPDVNIQRVQLTANGSERQHELQLRMQGAPFSGQLDLAGRFDRQSQRWTGTLSNTRLQTPVGPWSLSRAMTLDYRHQEQKISIGSHCWENPNAELCVPQPIEAGSQGRAVVNLTRFNLLMLQPFMPKTTQASGVFSGNADISWDTTKEGLAQGNVTLSGRNVQVTQTVNDAPLPVAFDTLNLSADLHNNRATLGWLVRLTNNGQLDGQIQVADLQGARNLSGNINIHHFSLAMINPIFSRGEKAAGTLNASLQPGGNIQNPQLFGQMQLSDIDIDGNFMPFDMQPSQVAMRFNGVSSTLQGEVRTAQGQMTLSGDADWSQLDNWRARVAAKGSRLRITVPPMVRMDVSPDVELTVTPSLFTLDGNVDVPWARMVVHEVPGSAVGVSGDEVMLNANRQPEHPPGTRTAINSHLTVHIGNDVRLDAFGLKARLTGDLKVVQDKQGLGLNGQINIPEGRFHAYGQDLVVRKGELLFSGPPDQPLLNIEAIRNPESTENEVIAGIRVTGSADQPKVDVFSDPVMSQQEALSYLLRGQGLDSEQSDSAAMTSMLVGLGVAHSGQVVGKIGETFGVSNLALDTQGAGDASQVVVSGYVLPGLQVKYGVGIFDSLATLTLRYRLMPKLYLEAVSGIDQALDLLYQFEF